VISYLFTPEDEALLRDWNALIMFQHPLERTDLIVWFDIQLNSLAGQRAHMDSHAGGLFVGCWGWLPVKLATQVLLGGAGPCIYMYVWYWEQRMLAAGARAPFSAVVADDGKRAGTVKVGDKEVGDEESARRSSR